MARLRYNGLRANLATTGGSLTTSATTINFQSALTHSNGTPVPTIVSPDYIPLTILDGSGHESEIVWLTAYTAAATTGTITRGQEGTTGVAHSSGDSVIHGPTAADLQVGVIGSTAYLAASDYTTTSSTHVQVDSTNLKVSFIAPPSGKVIVELTGLLGGPNAIGHWVEWSLFESGTLISGTPKQALQGSGVILAMATRHVITGLSPGSSHTYTWGWRAVTCTGSLYASVDSAVMTVIALP